MKKKAKTKDLHLDYTARTLPHAAAMQFEFEGKVNFVAISIPQMGVFLVRQDRPNPSTCWTYPAGTGFNDAVSRTIQTVLEKAAKEKKGKKA